jgi:cell wall-associated NlpC family hydrolase
MAWEAAKLAVAGVAVLAAGAAAGWFVVGPVWFTPPPVPALPLVSSSAPAAPKQHPSLSPSHHRPHRHVVVVPQAADRYMGTWLPAPGLRTEPLAAARRKASGEAIAEAALMFLGAPYEWGGLTVEGIDCSGLVQAVHRRFGMLLPRNADQQETAGHEVSLRSAQPGDLLCYGDHIAIALESGEIVHASKEQGKIVQERHPADMKKRLRTVRRVFDGDD